MPYKPCRFGKGDEPITGSSVWVLGLVNIGLYGALVLGVLERAFIEP